MRKARDRQTASAMAASNATRRVAERSAFTLVELLVVITIIGILVALLLPAVQAARESGRRNICANNLKQLALGCCQHESNLGYFPPGGWGYTWAGVADQGAGPNQPGGWLYNILPYIDQQALHDVDAGNYPKNLSALATGISLRVNTPLGVMNCPTRRPIGLVTTGPYINPSFIYANPTPMCARGDFVINGGEQFISVGAGPSSIAAAATNSWPAATSNGAWTFFGVSLAHAWIPAAAITDGLTNTYLVGEKYLEPSNYSNGVDWGDNECMYGGDDLDMNRWSGNSASGYIPPIPDTPGFYNYYSFGSAHATTWNAALCDGSVRPISYAISPEVHRRLANRRDGQSLDQSAF